MDIIFNLSPAMVIGLLVYTILPIIVGLITTRVTSPGTKAVVLAAISALAGLLTELLNSINAGTAYDLGTGLLLALTAFLVATAMHFGLWKPTGTSAKAQAVLVTPRHSK
jgi:hypothetical protein